MTEGEEEEDFANAAPAGRVCNPCAAPPPTTKAEACRGRVETASTAAPRRAIAEVFIARRVFLLFFALAAPAVPASRGLSDGRLAISRKLRPFRCGCSGWKQKRRNAREVSAVVGRWAAAAAGRQPTMLVPCIV